MMASHSARASMSQVNRGLANRIVVVTGAASGIGASTARSFASEGATVFVADIDEEGCLRTAGQIHGKAAGEFALFIDVTIEKDWEIGLQRVVDAFGRLDVLVNSAGISFAAPVTEMT